MDLKKTFFCGFLLFLSSALSGVHAENSMTFGDYVVHYNAFRSDTLTPEIAQAYQLTRRNNRMATNITVLKREADGKTTPVKAKIEGFASNLNGQVKTLDFKEIQDGPAIYYIAQAQVSHQETLKFELKVSPQGSNITGTVKFQQQFFTD